MRQGLIKSPVKLAELKRLPKGKVVSRAQQRYVDLVNNLNVGVYRSTPDPEGRFVEVNPAMVSMLKAKSKDELLKHKVSDFYKDRAKRKEISRKLMKTGFIQDEPLKFRTLTGKQFWVSATAVRTVDSEGHVFLTVSLRISRSAKRPKRPYGN
ncbi:MAG: PAS domain-containing protein [Candidatus Omnitrophica bacterium]|nr:PAS domain-containing protein [Candidatus Omnitrophota bacterium]